jgi:xanthine/CO dehydrogenase XdhC/CoxF family maturation factor
MVRHGAVVERYSTLFDDTAEIPYGLGCGGTVDLLLEPAGTPEFVELMEALAATLQHETRQVVTQLPENGRPLRRTVLDEAGQVLFPAGKPVAEWGGGPHEPEGVREAEGTFAEWLRPAQRLVLVGAGDDAQPVVSMAAQLGWSVTVVDGRAQWATPERFPEAEQVLTVADPAQVAMGEHDAVVVMTHSYEQDRMWLSAALRCRPRYLGLLGARHRSALLVSEAAARLGWSVERACEGLFAPVGLDLGGDGAEAIALAVIAEIQGCVEGKLGSSRRMTAELVEEQIAQGGASRYLQTQCAL